MHSKDLIANVFSILQIIFPRAFRPKVLKIILHKITKPTNPNFILIKKKKFMAEFSNLSFNECKKKKKEEDVLGTIS